MSELSERLRALAEHVAGQLESLLPFLGTSGVRTEWRDRIADCRKAALIVEAFERSGFEVAPRKLWASR
jgi:hypothetical protein